MHHLHHCVSARSFRALWMLEELQLPYTLHMLPFPPRVLQRSYLELNPLGTVPLLRHGEARLTESAAICEYLGALHPGAGLSVQPQEADFAAYLNWLHMSDATLTFPQTLVLRYTHFEPAERRQPQVAQDYQRWFLARLRAVEQAVEQRHWLAADRFTAADVAVGYALMLSAHLEMEPQWGPATQAYWQRLQQRPAFQRALQAEQQAARAQAVDETPSPQLR
ncbi:glutathione S-transferase family protein [Delftia tsuruhatensis]|uniref:glutathione S-transferase family protein n=1 Tax=Delftia tsuruhatensis TaxID=180282 RepID=UPI002443BB36|nr:glutathione S-transferase family protein [Delftia tsuruhatensis]MDH0775130.1 glutathione S-transferase family protein [Delftia tsuruhatensis]MDH1459092.1 glutathione S-transferase family protein [Delftia tsuruhatensis]MDH1824418.1 glutathione S-transferase family protein [Delftia tsuruhatensis]WGG11660.1 glutathione S-transferase family protein [Delftia tsuruhatensis]